MGAPVRMHAVRAMAARALAAGSAFTLAVVNDPASGIDAATFNRAVLACAIQLQRDVAPEYGLPAPTVVAMGHGDARPAGEHVAVLDVVSSIPSAPEDQGFHTPLDSGEPFDGYISTEGVDVDGFSECLSHELIETLVDPTCAVVYAAADGSKIPQEPGDPCQAGGDNPNASRVPIEVDGVTVWCTNWAKKAWGLVGDTSGAKKDYLGLLPTNIDFPVAPYGYVAKTSADGTETDVFGADGQRVELPARKQHLDCKIQQRLAAMRGASAP
jgi:hypothetical protein